MNKLEVIKDWFGRHFELLETKYPDPTIVREVFQASGVRHLLPETEDPGQLLEGGMAINKIIEFRSLNHGQTGTVALTFSGSRKEIMPMYEFSQSELATTIRGDLGIERHWFLVFEGGFEAIETNGREPSLKHMIDDLDGLWFSNKPCTMMVDESRLSEVCEPSLVA